VEVTDVSQGNSQPDQRQAAMEALRASEERYRKLFEAMDDGFCVLQVLFDERDQPIDYRFLETNAAFETQSGLKNAVGKTVRELVPDLDPSSIRLYGNVASTGEPRRSENHAQAMSRWFDVYASRVGPPELRHVGVFFKDVTARKAAEADRERLLMEVEDAHARLQNLFQLAPAFLCATRGPDHVFEMMNPRYQQLVGAGRPIVGLAVKDALPEVVEQGFIGLLDGVYRTGEPFIGREALIRLDRQGDGRLDEAFVTFIYQPSRGTNGLVDGIDVFGFEVTEQVVARKQAEEANRLKDEFLATVSHELRTPLTAILGWVQLLRSGKLPPEKHTRALETVERNARAQGQLIEDLLDVSRILSGKMKLEVEPFEVAPVVEGVLESLRPAAAAKDIRLQTAMDSAGSAIGDAHRLGQVVWNLLSNAVKFTPQGGRVQVFVERRDSSMEITVADTGQGMSKEFLPHVFERFRQEEGGSKRVHGGLGLGLSIVRHVVELHGGTVSALSEGEGKGSTFTVRLPLSVALRRQAAMAHAPPPQAMGEGFESPPQLSGLHILIVDDEGDTRELLRALLEGCEAHVILATSAAEGLARLREERPDVLVSDIGMPEADGYDFIRQIRALRPEEGGRTPAVALTAYARVEDRTRALLAGFQTHVPKPVEPVELLAVIASLSGRTGPRRS
jgi:PAS domain S-box-containing protein